jgi:hypothetical protein
VTGCPKSRTLSGNERKVAIVTTRGDHRDPGRGGIPPQDGDRPWCLTASAMENPDGSPQLLQYPTRFGCVPAASVNSRPVDRPPVVRSQLRPGKRPELTVGHRSMRSHFSPIVLPHLAAGISRAVMAVSAWNTEATAKLFRIELVDSVIIAGPADVAIRSLPLLQLRRPRASSASNGHLPNALAAPRHDL